MRRRAKEVLPNVEQNNQIILIGEQTENIEFGLERGNKLGGSLWVGGEFHSSSQKSAQEEKRRYFFKENDSKQGAN
jgi:hypothetical protein